ncbi:WSC domain-containing protein isoform 2 [Cladophialophora immunda]|nr:WSC domain-containing protein isoform 2 [Cladophialophora immunda]
MARSLLRAVALASALALFTAPVSAQSGSSTATSTNAPKAITTLGCYDHPDPLTSQGDYTFQTSGYCQGVCVQLNKPVMAITGGSTCYCGDELPALDTEVDPDSCNSPCNGYSQQTCGGIGFWQVYLTGLTADVETAPNSTSSSSSSTATQSGGSSTSQPAVVTKPGETIVVTASATASADKSSSGTSKVGIAVGVVVGVVGLSGIIGGVLLYLRHKRNREIEEEHRRNAAVSSFVGSGKSDKSSTDQRLDPSIYSHRRQSIGSIADERDFSRRILQVRNPDRESKSSAMA